MSCRGGRTRRRIDCCVETGRGGLGPGARRLLRRQMVNCNRRGRHGLAGRCCIGPVHIPGKEAQFNKVQCRRIASHLHFPTIHPGMGESAFCRRWTHCADMQTAGYAAPAKHTSSSEGARQAKRLKGSQRTGAAYRTRDFLSSDVLQHRQRLRRRGGEGWSKTRAQVLKWHKGK
jgi:hypothetical protein